MKIVAGGGKKKARNFGPPTLLGPTLLGSTLRGSTFSRFGASTLSAPTLLGSTLLGSTLRAPNPAGPQPFGAPTLRGPNPSGPQPFGAPTFFAPLFLGLGLHPWGPPFEPTFCRPKIQHPKIGLAEVEIGRSRNWPKSNWPNSKKRAGRSRSPPFLKRLRGRRGFTRQPENSKRAHFRAPALQTPPKFHTPREGRKNENCLKLRGTEMCTFGVLRLSCEARAAPMYVL